MRKEYDFTAARKNSYAAQMKKPVTIRLDPDAVTYFKALAGEAGILYQSLINLYLRDCAASKKKITRLGVRQSGWRRQRDSECCRSSRRGW